MRTADADLIAALELLAVELQLSCAVSIVDRAPKMPPATEHSVADGLVAGRSEYGYAASAGHPLATPGV